VRGVCVAGGGQEGISGERKRQRGRWMVKMTLRIVRERWELDTTKGQGRIASLRPTSWQTQTRSEGSVRKNFNKMQGIGLWVSSSSAAGAALPRDTWGPSHAWSRWKETTRPPETDHIESTLRQPGAF